MHRSREQKKSAADGPLQQYACEDPRRRFDHHRTVVFPVQRRRKRSGECPAAVARNRGRRPTAFVRGRVHDLSRFRQRHGWASPHIQRDPCERRARGHGRAASVVRRVRAFEIHVRRRDDRLLFDQ